MTVSLRIICVAGMIDAKLNAKLAPILAIPEVIQVYLIRRNAFQAPKVICCSPPRYWRWKPFAEVWRLLRLFALCRRECPDVLLAMGLVPHGWYVALAGYWFGIPTIQHVMGKNDFNLPVLRKPGLWLSLRAVKSAARVAVRGTVTMDWLAAQGIPHESIFVQHNVHPFKLFAPETQLNNGNDVEAGISRPFDLVYVGLLASYKRLDLTLKMFAHVCEQRPATRLLLVGDGPLRKSLEIQAAQLGIADRVHFAGRVEFNELPRHYNSARAFVMTSTGEGLPQAMVEAMSCGLPVIMPMDADIGDLAQHEVNALLYPAGDAPACAEAVLRLLNDATLYDRLRRGTLDLRRQYAQAYSLECQAETWREQILATVDTAAS